MTTAPAIAIPTIAPVESFFLEGGGGGGVLVGDGVLVGLGMVRVGDRDATVACCSK